MIFNLPTFTWQAGEYKRYYVRPRRSDCSVVSLVGAKVWVAAVDAINPTSTPLLRKECEIVGADSDNYILIEILPEDTADFITGCYIYNLTVVDIDGRPEIFAGHWHILENYDKASITE